MTVIGGEVVEREIPGVGLLRFENCGPGEWLTQAMQPARKGRRRYLLEAHGGEVVELESVSSIVAALDKGGLPEWIEREATIGAVIAERQGALMDVPREQWLARCRALKLGASFARDEAAGRGTAIHVAFKGMAETGEPPNALDYPEAWRPWLRGSVRAWMALDPEPIESEQIVCNPGLRYAGRPDLYAMCHGKRTLVDYKTGKGRVFDQGHYQTRGYAECFEPCALEPPDRIVIVGIDSDGGFHLVDCEATAPDFHDLLNVYRARKRINAGMAAQRKALKAAA